MSVHNPSDPPRVLVVEDEPRMRDLLTDLLPDMGFSSVAVRTAEEALKIMEADPHEIAIVDLNLPGMEGMEFFTTVRERWPRTQVIILTGFGDLESARQAIRLNVVDFLTKPCHLGDLEVALLTPRKNAGVASRSCRKRRMRRKRRRRPKPALIPPRSKNSSAATSSPPWPAMAAIAPPPPPN